MDDQAERVRRILVYGKVEPMVGDVVEIRTSKAFDSNPYGDNNHRLDVFNGERGTVSGLTNFNHKRDGGIIHARVDPEPRASFKESPIRLRDLVVIHCATQEE